MQRATPTRWFAALTALAAAGALGFAVIADTPPSRLSPPDGDGAATSQASAVASALSPGEPERLVVAYASAMDHASIDDFAPTQRQAVRELLAMHLAATARSTGSMGDRLLSMFEPLTDLVRCTVLETNERHVAVQCRSAAPALGLEVGDRITLYFSRLRRHGEVLARHGFEQLPQPVVGGTQTLLVCAPGEHARCVLVSPPLPR